MKAKTIPILFLILTVILSCLAAAQGGFPAASALGAAETVRGMQSVIRGDAGTFVMRHGEQFLMAWPRGGQYAIAMIGEGSRAGVQGLRQSATSLSELVRALESAGWQYAAPGSLPAAVISAIGAYSLDIAAVGLRSLPSVILLPVTVMPDPMNAEVLQ